MSRRPEFSRSVLGEGGDAYTAERALARRLRGNSRRVAPAMLLFGVIGTAGVVWLSLSELPHVARIFQGAAPKAASAPARKRPCPAGSRRRTLDPAKPCAVAGPGDLARGSRTDGGC